jgi:hypothetical protein
VVDVFEEVEGELRSDKWRRLAFRWGPWIGGALLLALVVALGFWAFDAWRTNAADKASVAYDRGVQAMSRNDLSAADAAFTEAAGAGSSAYKSMALMQRAGVALLRNQEAQAVTLLDQAGKADRSPLLADAARLKAALLVMDTAPIADVAARLEPLVKDGRPFQASAREALAMARVQAGQVREARSDFVILSLGQNIPVSMRQRAQAAIRMIDAGTAPALAQIVRSAGELPAAQRPAPMNPFLPQQQPQGPGGPAQAGPPEQPPVQQPAQPGAAQ